MKRRPISPFSLSFLDVMFCGFGAVVLLVLILNADTVESRNEIFSDLRSEVVRLEQERIVGRENLLAARNSLAETEEEVVATEGETERVIREIRDLEIEIATLRQETLAKKDHVRQLTSDLQALDDENRRLGAESAAQRDEGERVHQVLGEGDRQYLTGLKIGGERILILLDTSASMLDETIVNVIRLRNLSDEQKLRAEKWRRATAAAEWLIAHLPRDARFQVYAFNTKARAVLPAAKGRWLDAAKREDVTGAVEGIFEIVPAGGTSLVHAFSVANELKPKPDNILLITDGLPTQGSKKPSATTVSPERRLGHFRSAQAVLPKGVPVNTILLPMEGDAYAAAAFWKLALDTQGSFLTPARDWP